MTAQEVFWKGQSGRQYKYYVHDLDTRWKDAPGNYIFAKKSGQGWVAIYVGETESLRDRIPNHEKWSCARRNGVTHIHAHVNNGGMAKRREEEDDLIAAHDPPCNEE
ncbi:MAG: hypothetical protein MI824_17130 [Hyphomicrobiales bacterium]|nr:hypothetical protein [Hyphomicrobiales bacterium]